MNYLATSDESINFNYSHKERCGHAVTHSIQHTIAANVGIKCLGFLTLFRLLLGVRIGRTRRIRIAITGTAAAAATAWAALAIARVRIRRRSGRIRAGTAVAWAVRAVGWGCVVFSLLCSGFWLGCSGIVFVIQFVEIFLQYLCARRAMNVFPFAFAFIAPMAKLQAFLTPDSFRKGGRKFGLLLFLSQFNGSQMHRQVLFD